MFIPTVSATMAMGGGGFDYGGGGGGGDGGLFGWFDELKRKLDDAATLRSLGISEDTLRQLKMLEELGILTPTLAQKLLFGEGGLGGGGGGTRLASDDPRYWQLQFQQLEQDLLNTGLDAETARRQALASLIQSRNAQQVNLAQTSGDIAAQAAQFAANPRDAVSELMFRNAVGGSTPFGAAQESPHFADYQSSLANKFQELFGGVAGDLSRAREFISAPPPAEFYGAETRTQLGLPPAPPLPRPQFSGGPTLPTPQAPSFFGFNTPEAAQGFQQEIAGATPEQLEALKKLAVPQMRFGGEMNFRPTDSEGGLNMNVHEPAMVVGMKSGQVYATMAEVEPEQLIVKPIPSIQQKKKQQQKHMQSVAKATPGAERMQAGGTITGMPDVTDFYNQLRTSLRGLGTPGGGTGDFSTKLPDLRLLAGSPWQALLDDPALMDMTLSGFSSLGIDPRTAAATVRKFTPNSPINNAPRLSFA